MTAQMPDEVFFEGEQFAVAAVDGTGLFDPREHDLEPQALHTACYRGRICHYAVVDRRLVLRELELGSENEPARIDGVRARRDEEFGSWHYQGLAVPVAFTGRLLIGSGGIDDRPHLNMGFRPAWMFAEVHELTFRAGELVAADDCSAAIAEIRPDMIAKPAEGESTEDWIHRTFSLTYEYSWPGRG
ncbi:hypothetical protein [Kutzneria buriramensis]|uniref:Uncharacterized protein n=1 Tax=Kutzneria buriramensis TaxID=1045776 RepID=A0A3E0H730_9PSEU|nr:hypothetical protein [Kutzneria buriramensis]REH39261.1 hypothetical protein BCF44_113116 [Kutzneria buriramensis]